MATDPETNQKLPMNRRDAMRAIAFGAAGVTLAACGGATTPAAAPTAAPAAEAATAAPAAEAATAAPAAEAATAAPADAATPAPAAGNVLRVAEATWPEQLDPQKASFQHEIVVLSTNFEGLTRYDKDLKTIPAAAESWEYNADGNEINFKQRDGQ